MKIARVKVAAEQLINPADRVWGSAAATSYPMVPTPLKGNPMIKAISPFMAKSEGHGAINQLSASGLHNGSVISIRVTWSSSGRDKIADLDQFVDGVAVMFPLSAKASAVTMGAKGDPVNAWYWKADKTDTPFDVVAEGYGTSERREGINSQLVSKGEYDGDNWHVVFQRPLDVGNQVAQFWPGTPLKLAFAVWDGGNNERAGRKSFSGEFNLIEVDG